MSLLSSTLQVLPVGGADPGTYYITMQPTTSGPTTNDYAALKLTYSPLSGNLYSPVVSAGAVYTTGLFWAGNGQVIQTGGGTGTGTGITFTASSAPPASGNTVGSQWYDTSSDILYSYENDGLTSHWVDITSPIIVANNSVSGTNYTPSSTPPTNPRVGDQWYNTTTDIVYEYIYDGNATYWVDINSDVGSNAVVGNIAITGNIIPTSNISFDIGSIASPMRNAYIGGSLTTANTVISVNNSSVVTAGSHLTLANPSGTQSSLGFTFNNTPAAEIRVDNGGNFLLNSTNGAFWFNNELGNNGPLILKTPTGAFLTVPNSTTTMVTGGNLDVTGSAGINLSNGGTVTAITRTAQGSGYTTLPTVSITAPTTASGVQATATPVMVAAGLSPTITSGGTGYTVNDVLTVSGGTPVSTSATITVTSVSGGVITGANYTNYGSYTALPSNPVSVTGGTGSGATFTISWSLNYCTITNSGSGYVEQPTVSFSGGSGSGAAAYATVGNETFIKTTGNVTSFSTDVGRVLRLTSGSGAANQAYAQLYNNATNVGYYAAGSSTNISATFVSQGTSPLNFATNSTSANQQFSIAHTASAVNYIQVTGAATTTSPVISAQGSDTSIHLTLTSKGSNDLQLRTATSGGWVWMQPNSVNTFAATYNANSVNYIQVKGGATGFAPTFYSQGNDTNVDLTLTPKGTGNVNITGNAVHTGSVVFSDATQFNTANSLGMRNRLINGSMGIWQRGTSFSTSTAYTYGSADRWMMSGSGATLTLAQTSTAPAGFKYAMSVSGTSVAYPGIAQRIESMNCTDLVGQSITISAQIAKTSGTTLVKCALFYANAIDNFAGGYTEILQGGAEPTLLASPTSSFQSCSATFTNLPAGAANGLMLIIFTASASSSDTMLISGVQLERGTVATPFEQRLYGTELSLCQRYYQISGRSFGVAISSNAVLINQQCVPTMRATPSVVLTTTSPYIENAPWAAIATTSGCTADNGHMTIYGGDVKITGTISGIASNQAIEFGGSQLLFSAEL